MNKIKLIVGAGMFLMPMMLASSASFATTESNYPDDYRHCETEDCRLKVQAKVKAWCRCRDARLDLGSFYSGRSAEEQGIVRVRCGGLAEAADVKLKFDGGQNGGTFGNNDRKMDSAGNKLPYGLFTTAGNNDINVDQATSLSMPLDASGFGGLGITARVPAGGNPLAGYYADHVSITIELP